MFLEIIEIPKKIPTEHLGLEKYLHQHRLDQLELQQDHLLPATLSTTTPNNLQYHLATQSTLQPRNLQHLLTITSSAITSNLQHLLAIPSTTTTKNLKHLPVIPSTTTLRSHLLPQLHHLLPHSAWYLVQMSVTTNVTQTRFVTPNTQNIQVLGSNMATASLVKNVLIFLLSVKIVTKWWIVKLLNLSLLQQLQLPQQLQQPQLQLQLLLQNLPCW